MIKTPEQICLRHLTQALTVLKNNKPADRSETARSYAVTITELEKVIAYYAVFVIHAIDFSQTQKSDNP
jgi:hypothetical protein